MRPGRGAGERTRDVAVESRPGGRVDLRLEGRLQRLVRVVRAQEIGVADEETLLVIVGVDEPAGDAAGIVAADLAGGGVEDVDAGDPHPDAAVAGVPDVDVGFAEDDEQVALAGVLQVAGHMQVGVHPRLEHGDPAQALEVGRMGVVVEGAGDQRVEAGLRRLARRGHQVGARHRAEFGTDEDSGAAFGRGLAVAFGIAPLGANICPRPGREGGEGDAVFPVRLLDSGALQGSPGPSRRSPPFPRSRCGGRQDCRRPRRSRPPRASGAGRGSRR